MQLRKWRTVLPLPDPKLESNFSPPILYTLDYRATSNSTDSFINSHQWLWTFHLAIGNVSNEWFHEWNPGDKSGRDVSLNWIPLTKGIYWIISLRNVLRDYIFPPHNYMKLAPWPPMGVLRKVRPCSISTGSQLVTNQGFRWMIRELPQVLKV